MSLGSNVYWGTSFVDFPCIHIVCTTLIVVKCMYVYLGHQYREDTDTFSFVVGILICLQEGLVARPRQ